MYYFYATNINYKHNFYSSQQVLHDALHCLVMKMNQIFDVLHLSKLSEELYTTTYEYMHLTE